MTNFRNNVQRIEAAIKAGQYGEPVLRFRVYSLIGSPTHIAAGADWMLSMSANTKADAEEMIKDHGHEHDFYIIIDGDAA